MSADPPVPGGVFFSDNLTRLKDIVLSIDFTDRVTLPRLLTQMIKVTPDVYLSVQGFHQNKLQRRVIDFDFQIYPQNPYLLRVELQDHDQDSFKVLMDRSDLSFSSDVTSQTCCQSISDLLVTGKYESFTLGKITEEIPISSVQKEIQGAKNRSAYGGNINIGFHNTSSSSTWKNSEPHQHGKSLHIVLVWSYQWLDIGNYTPYHPHRRYNPTWKGRLPTAMVDGEVGWILNNQPLPAGNAFWRALSKHHCVTRGHQIPMGQGGGRGEFYYRKWGCDEK